MNVTFDRNRGLIVSGFIFPATSKTRTIANGRRKPSEVIFTEGSTLPHNLPYMPEPFPTGRFYITGVEKMPEDSLFWPYLIRTDASRRLPVWILDNNGHYLRASTENYFTDRGLHIHHARYFDGSKLVPSSTTHGCIGMTSPEDICTLAELLLDMFPSGTIPAGLIPLEAK